MRVETIRPGPELADAPARPGPVQLTLDEAPRRQQLDGQTKAMLWLHMYGPDRLDDLRRFTRLVGDVLDAIGRGDTDAATDADRRLTDARLEWEPTVTLSDIDRAEALHRGCTDCWPAQSAGQNAPTDNTGDVHA